MMSDQRKYNGALPLDFSTAPTEPMTNDQIKSGEELDRRFTIKDSTFTDVRVVVGNHVYFWQDDAVGGNTAQLNLTPGGAAKLAQELLSRTPSHGRVSDIMAERMIEAQSIAACMQHQDNCTGSPDYPNMCGCGLEQLRHKLTLPALSTPAENEASLAALNASCASRGIEPLPVTIGGTEAKFAKDAAPIPVEGEADDD